MSGTQREGIIAFMLVTSMVATLYAVTGILGLKLATGSPFSTPIFIPSGIALGAVLVFGLQALPGIFLGSLYINYHVSTQTFLTFTHIGPLQIGCIIGLGAVVQAIVGWLLVRRWIKLNNPLIEPNDIILFAFLTGVVSSLINASTSNTSLYLLGLLHAENYFQSWLTWYIGDSIGILIFTPVFLILFAEPKSIWRNRVKPILIPLCVSFAVVITAYAIALYKFALTEQLWFVLICGLLFCSVINIILFIINGQRNLAELELKQTLRSAGEAIISVGLDETIIYANPAATRMWKKPEDSLSGINIHQLLKGINHHDHDTASPCPIQAAIHSNSVTRIESALITRDDRSEFWAEYTCTPLVISNHTKGAVIVVNDITARREAEFNLVRLAHFDMLTGLPNRHSFINTLELAVNSGIDKNTMLSVVFIDLDNFKIINDTLGHAAGDIALAKLSTIIAEHLEPTDYFARLGGDEFGIIIRRTDRRLLEIFLEKLTLAVSHPIMIHDTVINITISVGVSSYPNGGVTAEELIKCADIAMYKAKELGKNTYAHFSDELSKAINRLHLIETELREAIPRSELEIHYQPQVNINNNQIIGLEVLLRWTNAELGSVPPAEFIPIAERNGMIHQIGEWVLQQLAREYIHFHQLLSPECKISINASVLQLNDSRFYKSLAALFKTNHFHNRLMVEITESALIANPKKTLEIMRNIRELGIEFSLDDFGMNYSSMRYLKSLPLSQLKIDYYFIKDITTDQNDLAIVSTILQLAKGLNLPAIAEGVETRAQLDILRTIGCERVQGFYYYKPMGLKYLLSILQAQTAPIKHD